MKRFQGKGVPGGIVIGRIQVCREEKLQTICRKITNIEAEVERFRQAKAEAERQLKELYCQAVEAVGETEAGIFEMHRLLLEDKDYTSYVERLIGEKGCNAEYAVEEAGGYFSHIFAQLEDEYMQARAGDIVDISKRLQKVLLGEAEADVLAKEPVILVAEELTPSETVRLDKDKVLALVTKRGFINSHTAILARTMGIPALVGVDMTIEALWDGCMGVVDGEEGCFYVEPEQEQLETFRGKQEAYEAKRQLLQSLKGQATITLDGKAMKLGANIGCLEDVTQVLQNDADGIGLFRSESIFLEQEVFPTEEEQFALYKAIVEKMEGKPVVIRTLDIGADKSCDYFALEKEENPALGCRAIRFCLSRPELFKMQLRALLRAGVYGDLSVLYPMIISLEEVQKIRMLLQECEKELTAEGIPFGKLKQGIMIETPAAVMISDELAREVDFFSIGTNDLTQYTLAIDRQNPKLEAFYHPHHPAVLRMIEMVVSNAHKAGIPVSICGELGADKALTRDFLAMGVDELSVSPGCILPLRKLIRETWVDKAK